MNHPTEPSQRIKVLFGIAAVMSILLSGVTLGVLPDGDAIVPISSNASDAPSALQEKQKGYARLALYQDGATRRGANKPCPQASPAPGGQMDADSITEQCGPHPMQIEKQKLIVLLALWRTML